MSVRKHYVTFYSPGTFVPESSVKEIPEWDTALAVEMAKDITERYDAKPYAFIFTTMLTANPIPDGEEGFLDVEPKKVASSGRYFLGGHVRSIDEVRETADPKERILLSNMEGNDFAYIITNDNSWRFTGEFAVEDCVLGEQGEIFIRGDYPDMMKYRAQKTKEKEERNRKFNAEWDKKYPKEVAS